MDSATPKQSTDNTSNNYVNGIKSSIRLGMLYSMVSGYIKDATNVIKN